MICFVFFKQDYKLIECIEENTFSPTTDEYFGKNTNESKLLLSNPCNPTEITRKKDELKELLEKPEERSNIKRYRL